MFFNLLQLLVVIITRLVARVFATCEQLVRNNAASPDIDLLTVSLATDLLWRHVERRASSLFCPLAPILFCRKTKVDDFDVDTVVALVYKQDIFGLKITMDDITCMYIGYTFEQAHHDLASFKVS